MSKHAAPRHRHATIDAPRKAVRAVVAIGGLAAAATAAVVVGGVAAGSGDASVVAATVSAPAWSSQSADVVRREAPVSRSDRREAADPEKAAALAAAAQTEVQAISETVDAATGDPKAIASALLADYGWSSSQFDCLDKLWERESHWNPLAHNASSGAHGIPQALPGSKMASVGADWATNPVTQIKWGLGYIQARYGSPCAAWGHSQSHGWY
ncbi:lytic transglycosylase domain-containing protein [Nocardioides sp.]|uniref:aggregation-promoting factor C-terminal-like domain-containing protein n=1 Tax=Nocardioides sp. TaxID=35761 RepID=UPI0039E6E7C7